MRPNSRRAALAAPLAILTLLGVAQTAAADEAQAREIFKAMSDYMAAQATLSFDFDSSLSVVTADGQKLAIASSGSIAIERPGNFHATRHGGFATVEAVYDGKTLSLLNQDAKTYAQLPLDGTIETLIDTLRDTYGRPLPAADLLLADVAGTLMPLVTDAKDLGSGVIGGEECDHLAFRTPDVDWQIWIAQGDAPHPCRYTITSLSQPSSPEYTVTIRNWGAGAEAADFAFAAPEGATRVDVKDLPDFDDVAGIYTIKGAN